LDGCHSDVLDFLVLEIREMVHLFVIDNIENLEQLGVLGVVVHRVELKTRLACLHGVQPIIIVLLARIAPQQTLLDFIFGQTEEPCCWIFPEEKK